MIKSLSSVGVSSLHNLENMLRATTRNARRAIKKKPSKQPRGGSDPETKPITRSKGRTVMFAREANVDTRSSGYGGRLGSYGDAFVGGSSESEGEEEYNQDDFDEDQLQVAAVEKTGGAASSDRKPCGICGSKLHHDADCWRNLKCKACGRTGHPTERCLSVCKACGKTHERGECKLQELFNQLRVWADGHENVLPAHIEKLLN